MPIGSTFGPPPTLDTRVLEEIVTKLRIIDVQLQYVGSFYQIGRILEELWPIELHTW